MYNDFSLHGPWWLIVLAALAFPLVLYYSLYYLRRRRVRSWLLIPLVIVLAPLGALAVIIDTVFLLVVVLTLYSMLAGYPPGQFMVGILFPSAWWVYLLEGAAALLMVAVIVYLIRRS